MAGGLGLGLGLSRGGAVVGAPTLLYDMNFAAGGALHADFTHTRTTSAWRRNNTGLWEEVGTGVLRFHHDAAGNPLGILLEEQRTSHALHNRDLTQTEWVKSASMAAAKDATGIDGAANSASTLTSSGTNQTALQSITLTSRALVFQPWIKRKTGTGTIEITIDGGATWVDVTSQIDGTAFTQVSTSQTLANPEVGFRLGTSGDEIEVDFAGLQGGGDGGFVTSPIETTTSAVTRNEDVTAGPNWPSEFTVVVHGVRSGDQDSNLFFAGANSSVTPLLIAKENNNGAVQTLNSTVLETSNGVTFGDSFKAAMSQSASGRQVVLDGGTVASDADVVDFTSALMLIGTRFTGSGFSINSTISRLKIWTGALSAADIQAETS